MIDEIFRSKGYRAFVRKCWTTVFVLFAVAVVLKVLNLSGGTVLLIVSMGLGAQLCFFRAFEPVAAHPWSEEYDLEGADVSAEVHRMIEEMDQVLAKGTTIQKMAVSAAVRGFLHKLLWWTVSVLLVAVLFVVVHWPGGYTFLSVVAVMAVVVVPLGMVLYSSLPPSWRGHKELF